MIVEKNIGIVKEEADLQEVIENVIGKFRDLSPAIKINLETLNKCSTLLPFDRGHITQVIQSLIDNAIRYSSGEILVALHDSFAIDRHDNDALVGAIRASVSCDFVAAHGNELDNGTRLCVAMCKVIIKLHGGEIWAKNNMDIGRLVVGFTLLYDKPDNKDADIVTQKEHAKNLRILYVDDEEICVASATMLLTDLGHEVTTASNGTEALSKLKTGYQDFDLVLLDIMMPAMNGLETLCVMKEHPEYQDLPVLMQSGMTDGLGLKHAMRLGARKDMLQKPFNREDVIKFLNVVSKYCKRYPHLNLENAED